LSGGVVGDEPPPFDASPEQPAISSAKIPVAAIQVRFTALSPIVTSVLTRGQSGTADCARLPASMASRCG
jgi:hypothetical protein